MLFLTLWFNLSAQVLFDGKSFPSHELGPDIRHFYLVLVFDLYL